MQAAPPVRIDVVPDPAGGRVVLLLATVAAANAAAWVGALAGSQGVSLALLAGAAATAAAWPLLGRGFGAAGRLVWDGVAWQWSAATERAVQPQVMIDLGSRMLLRLRPIELRHPATWAVAKQASAGGAWSAWRAALLAPARPVPSTPGALT